MTPNIAFQQEQEQRIQNDLIAVEEQIIEEASRETDWYSGGFFDGLIGLEPSHPEKQSYWSGYEIGSREYWAKKLGVEIPTEF